MDKQTKALQELGQLLLPFVSWVENTKLYKWLDKK